MALMAMIRVYTRVRNTAVRGKDTLLSAAFNEREGIRSGRKGRDDEATCG